ncbi:MAG: hypothetical protein AB2558_00835 [Candidatus Thiodiazotropha sp.]
MKSYRWISNLTVGVLALVASSSVLAANLDRTLTLGETETYNHVNDPGTFTDTGTFTLLADSPISVSLVDNEIGSTFGPILDVSSFTVTSGGFTATFDDLTSHVFSLGNLVADTYTLTFNGTSNGFAGAVYDVTVSAVPVPAAVWLFGSALVGFATFSARRSV